AAATASASWSRPRMRRCGWASRMAREWPAPPSVASTTRPGGTGAKSSTTRSTMTGRWSKPGLASGSGRSSGAIASSDPVEGLGDGVQLLVGDGLDVVRGAHAEVLHVPGDQRLATELEPLAEPRRQEDPS